jgi:hypothetical protein
LLALSLAAAAEESWDPAKTHAVLVGILEWQDKGLGSFPKEGRQDRELEKRLVAAGVPASQIAFLEDKAATQEAITTSLKDVAARAGEGSTFIFYFAGHGLQDDGGETYISNYDCNTKKKKATAIGMADISRIVRNQFKGSRAIFLADCCHSGAFSRVAFEVATELRIPAAALTSAQASNISTGAWTFTESLVTVFRGDGVPDANRDGRITLRETADFSRDRMRFEAGQLSLASVAGDFSWELVVRPVGTPAKEIPGPWQLGQYVEIEWKGKWWRGQVLDGREGEWQVHYTGFEASDDEWVTGKRLRKPQGLSLSGGATVQVEWSGKWYPAKVLKVEDDFALIHYDGYGAEWDEWVGEKRLRMKK